MPKVSEAHLAQRRQQILDAALACFARSGFHQTTMADIAAEAGVSDSLAYRYFSGKEEIIEAVVREWNVSPIDTPLSPSAGDVEDFRALFDLLLSSSVRRLEQRPDARTMLSVRFRSWAEALDNKDVRDEVLRRWNNHFDAAEGLVVRAQEEGQIAGELDSRSVARVMLALHDGLDLQGVLDPGINLEKCREVTSAMFFGEFWNEEHG